MKKKMKRVLVISNNCFSKTNSNGRTLGNLFYNYEKSKISQLYISGEPDYDYCKNYFCISDREVLNNVLGKNNNQHKNFSVKKEQPIAEIKKSVVTMLCRNLVWKIGFWKTEGLMNWLDNVRPEVIVLQVGDCKFFIDITIQISKMYNAKIILYNTEAYYFKQYNYFRDGHNLLYRLFLNSYKKSFKRLMEYAVESVYLCDELDEIYNKEFCGKSSVIYNSSSISAKPLCSDHFPVISYIGNLSLGRHQSLIKVANILQSINKKLSVNVYGMANEKILEDFKNTPGINYWGYIDYNSVVKVIEESHVLLHIESFEDFYIKDSEFGFSGKIADSLCSGRLFFVYAPENVSCIKYLRRNQIGVTATNDIELFEELKKIVESKVYCMKLIDRQLKIASQNHNLAKNSNKFINIVNQ